MYVCVYIYTRTHSHTLGHSVYICIQDVQGVKVIISGFNSRADSESKSHTHMGQIRNGSGVMSF